MTRLKARPTRARVVCMMLAKCCLGIVQKRVIYECLVQTEQNGPDQTKTPGEVAVGNGGAGWKLFTWAGGHGLRRGPLQDAFSLLAGACQVSFGTSLNPPEYVPAAVSQRIGTPAQPSRRSASAGGPANTLLALTSFIFFLSQHKTHLGMF